MERRAVSSLKFILPAGVCAAAESGRGSLNVSHTTSPESSSPPGAVCQVERTLLYQEVWRLSGTLRVNRRNCKDCRRLMESRA